MVLIHSLYRRKNSLMKRLLTLAALLALLVSSAAFAGVQDFGKLTVDVAQGWTGTVQDGTVVITKNDNTSQLTISIADAGGATKAQLAEAFAAEFSKSFVSVSKPEADKDGDYSWDMKTANGADSHAILTVEGSEFVLLVITNPTAAPSDLSAMLDSIKQK